MIFMEERAILLNLILSHMVFNTLLLKIYQSILLKNVFKKIQHLFILKRHQIHYLN